MSEGSSTDTPLPTADQQAAATHRARIARGASPASWAAAGWVPGPPVVATARRRFALRGIAIALGITLMGVSLAAAIGSRDGQADSAHTRDRLAVGDPASLPRLEDAACRFQTPIDDGVTCHDLVVLQDRSDPAAGALRVHVAIFPADVPDPAPTRSSS